VWARPTPPGAPNAAVYGLVTSPDDDTVIGASVDLSIAGGVTLHESMTGEESGSHHGDGAHDAHDAVDATEAARALAFSSAEPLALEPGGRHLMLTGLTAPLAEGSTFAISVELASGALLTAEVVVATNDPWS
jgi:periplasmic copper chaperone A